MPYGRCAAFFAATTRGMTATKTNLATLYLRRGTDAQTHQQPDFRWRPLRHNAVGTLTARMFSHVIEAFAALVRWPPPRRRGHASPASRLCLAAKAWTPPAMVNRRPTNHTSRAFRNPPPTHGWDSSLDGSALAGIVCPRGPRPRHHTALDEHYLALHRQLRQTLQIIGLTATSPHNSCP